MEEKLKKDSMKSADSCGCGHEHAHHSHDEHEEHHDHEHHHHDEHCGCGCEDHEHEHHHAHTLETYQSLLDRFSEDEQQAIEKFLEALVGEIGK